MLHCTLKVGNHYLDLVFRPHEIELLLLPVQFLTANPCSSRCTENLALH